MNVRLSKSSNNKTLIKFIFKSPNPSISDFSGEESEIVYRYSEGKTIIYCGLGDKKSNTTQKIRQASAKGIQKAIELKRSSATLVIDSNITCSEEAAAAVEGALLGAYKFTKYKSVQPVTINSIDIDCSILSTSDLRRIKSITDAVNYARDLVNSNAHEITPERLEHEARILGKHEKIKLEILSEKELRKNNLNLITAVGQGSSTPPRLIIIEYTGNPHSKIKTAIVGKGITFDSGGQNLKPTGHIETMRFDMAGAATVLGVMNSLITSKAPVNVIGVIAAAHNALSSKAYFPGDIYTSYAGKTVEILSTDAEGRLVLADAIAYCEKKYKPTEIIDFATLTGGILAALGDLVAGLFSNDDALAKKLFTSGELTGERVWQFPIYKEYSDSLKSDLADLRNLSKLKKGYASSITGAAFIKEFVTATPWAHIDIAGTAYNEGSCRGEIPQFGTGFGVRLMINYLITRHK